MLQGNSIRLTPLSEGDAERLLAWRNSIELKRLTGSGPFVPLDPSSIQVESTATNIQFAIRQVNDEEMLGYVALLNIAWNNRTADLGIMIGSEESRGQGFGSEAISLLLEYAFQELNLYRVQLDVVDYNEAAIRTYSRLGFIQEGARREHGERDGKRYDVLLFGILAPDWNSLMGTKAPSESRLR